MKKCPYCGTDYPDDVNVCPVDHNPLQPIGQAPVLTPTTSDGSLHDEISPEEKRFWERMTFRQFAIVVIRIQAVWLIFNGLVDASYLSRYVGYSGRLSVFQAMSSYEKREFLMLLLRVAFHFAAAIFLIQKAERVLSWLVKDYVESSANRGK